jgi:hypothetical protein
MATRKTIGGDAPSVNMAEFKRMKAQVEQHATAEIAKRLELIEQAFREIAQLIADSGVEVSFYDVTAALSNARNAADPDWNSSSAHC